MDQHEPISPEPVVFTAAVFAGHEDALADLDVNGSALCRDVLTWRVNLDTNNPLSELQLSKS